MLNIIASGVTYIFPGGRMLKLIKNGVNVTNSTNPLILAKNVTLTIVDCCAPRPVSLAFHCVAVSALIGTSIVTPNPVTIGSTIHIIVS